MDPQPRRKTTLGKAQSRTTFACTNCRRSKVKCDERRPICARCQRMNIMCSGPTLPLKWADDYHGQGKAFGRAGVRGKRQGSPSGRPSFATTAEKSEQKLLETPSVLPWNYVHYDSLSVTRMYQRDQLRRARVLLPARDLKHLAYDESSRPSGTRTSKAEPTTSVPQTLAVFPVLKNLRHETLFHYYINHICPRATSSNQHHSPFASVILPYCQSASPAVFKSIQALAACHWSQNDPSYTTTSLVLKSQVLRDLRRRLAHDQSFLLSKDPEITVILMMICLYEIVDHCDRQWIVHLQGAKDIIQYRKRIMHRDGHGLPQDAVSSFTELFFAFQDVMGRTACAKADLFGTTYWREDDCVIHPWMGCSPALISILFAIMDLSRRRRDICTQADEIAFSMQSALLNQRLDALAQTLADPEDHTLQAVGELKKLACVIYLNCALYSAGPASPMIKNHVRRILKLVSELTAKQFSGNIIWPLFVAAVELDPLNDEVCFDDRSRPGPETGNVVHGRQLVLEALMAVGRSSVSGVSRARYVIQEVWQARDFDLEHSPDPKNPLPASLNDWERYVVPVSDALSLV